MKHNSKTKLNLPFLLLVDDLHQIQEAPKSQAQRKVNRRLNFEVI